MDFFRLQRLHTIQNNQTISHHQNTSLSCINMHLHFPLNENRRFQKSILSKTSIFFTQTFSDFRSGSQLIYCSSSFFFVTKMMFISFQFLLCIIKYPFWQMTNTFQHAFYVCLNQGEAYAPEEIRRKSVCMNEDIGEILKELWL